MKKSDDLFLFRTLGIRGIRGNRGIGGIGGIGEVFHITPSLHHFITPSLKKVQQPKVLLRF